MLLLENKELLSKYKDVDSRCGLRNNISTADLQKTEDEFLERMALLNWTEAGSYNVVYTNTHR